MSGNNDDHDNNIVDELEEVFHECNDNFIPSDSVLLRNGEESKMQSKRITPAETPNKSEQTYIEEVKGQND